MHATCHIICKEKLSRRNDKTWDICARVRARLISLTLAVGCSIGNDVMFFKCLASQFNIDLYFVTCVDTNCRRVRTIFPLNIDRMSHVLRIL